MFLCTKLTHLYFIVSFFLLMCNSISLKMNKFLKIKVLRKALFAFASLTALVASCTESMEDRAVREAREYTEKVCPTPYINDSRTDSAVFDKDSRTYIYYLSLRNKADNAEAIALNRNKLHNMQKQALDNNPALKSYKEAHFSFRFIYRSASNPQKILLDDTFKY